MLSFYLLLILYGSNSVPLMLMHNDNATKPQNMLSEIKSDPKKFVSEVANLDPSAIKHIVSLLEALLEESEARETELDTDLSNKNTALADDDAAVTNAEKVLADAELAVSQAKADLESKNSNHGDSLSEKQTSQSNHDDEVPGLNDEQRVLREVIALLMGLHETASSGSGCSSAATDSHEIEGTGIYVCQGSWTTPGINAGGVALCGAGTELCDWEGINKLNKQQCDNPFGDGTTGFYGTAVSSHGGWSCLKHDGGSGKNDVWGCGDRCSNGGATCGIMDCALGNSNFDGWGGLQHGGSEKDHIVHSRDTEGGVMCCPKA